MSNLQMSLGTTSNQNEARRSRKYHHLTCANCRKRKAKCDGLQPICTTCKGFGDSACLYDKPASIAYVRHLERKVKELSRDAESRAAAEARNSGNLEISGKTLAPASTAAGAQSKSEGRSSVSSESTASPSNERVAAPAVPSATHFFGRQVPLARNLSREEQKEYLVSNAADCRKYEKLILQNFLQISNLAFIPVDSAQKLLDFYWVCIHPLTLTLYRPSFYRDMALYVPGEPARPLQVFSPALLCSLLAECSYFFRHDPEFSALLNQQALNLFLQDICKPSSGATLITALARSGRAMWEGNRSQLWTFSGIAFRIASDLDMSTSHNINVLEAESLRRIRIGCFIWDKNISLYLGRLPSILKSQSSVHDFLDDFQNMEIWDYQRSDEEFSSRHGGSLNGQTPGAQSNIEALRARFGGIASANSVFLALSGSSSPGDFSDTVPSPTYCIQAVHHKFQLYEILGKIITDMYGSGSGPLQGGSFLHADIPHTESKFQHNSNSPSPLVSLPQTALDVINELDQIWQSIPDYLKVKPDNHSLMPPNILSMNLLFHSVYIILLLPYLNIPHKGVELTVAKLVVHAAGFIRHITWQYMNLFDLGFVSYWTPYSPYLAANALVLLLDKNAHDEDCRKGILNDLKFFLTVFQASPNPLPSVKITRLLIEERIAAEEARMASAASPHNINTNGLTQSSIPVRAATGTTGIAISQDSRIPRDAGLSENDNDAAYRSPLSNSISAAGSSGSISGSLSSSVSGVSTQEGLHRGPSGHSTRMSGIPSYTADPRRQSGSNVSGPLVAQFRYDEPVPIQSLPVFPGQYVSHPDFQMYDSVMGSNNMASIDWSQIAGGSMLYEFEDHETGASGSSAGGSGGGHNSGGSGGVGNTAQ